MSKKRFPGSISQLWVALVGAFSLTAFAAPANFPDALLTTANPRVREVIDIQESVTPDLMATDGILGTAVGDDDAGGLAMIVYVNVENQNRGAIMRSLPRVIKGVRVVVNLTDPFYAPAKGGKVTRVSHTAKQTPPIQLGTSGGWQYDLANGYCCSGTLGSLVQIGKKQYILSNYHVFWADIVSGGNSLVATAGQPVIQPGLVDIGCNASAAQSVADLAGSRTLPNSNVDAAIAEVQPNMVRADGAILEIGTLSASPVEASVGQPVKKSGRTTGLSRSTVAALNATVSITYENECAGGTAFTKTFTGQIVVKNLGSKFLAGGDSGSLMVEDVTNSPRAVGLLFAGSSTSAIANPIGEVLTVLGVSMVGK